MQHIRKLGFKAVCLVTLLGLLFPQAVPGITPGREKELSRKFMKAASEQFTFLNDHQIVNCVNRVGKRILETLPVPNYQYRFYVIQDDSYNAFAGPGGLIFIHSGLIEAMESESELAGILSHEIAHVTSRHISDRIERSKKIGVASLAGLVAAIALGTAGGGSLAEAAAVGSLAAGQSLSLAYSREDEEQADQVGLSYLTDAGYSVQGLLAILKKIKAQRWFGPDQIPTYLMTHPAVEERITYLSTWLETNRETVDGLSLVDEYDFDKARIRLIALYGDKETARIGLKNRLERHPQDPLSHYGYGLICARTGHRREGLTHLRKGLERKAFDTEMLIDTGRVQFLDGDYNQALSTLEGALGLAPDQPDGLFFLGRTHLELGNLESARHRFKVLVEKYPVYEGANFFLAKAYGQLGNQAEAHYYLGIAYAQKEKYRAAIFQLKQALALIKDPQKAETVNRKLDEIKALYKEVKKEEREKALKKK